MGGLTSATEDAIAARKAAKEVNYSLDNQLRRDSASKVKGKVTYFTVNETESIVSLFLHYAVRYCPHHRLLHSLIVRQMQYIIKIINLLADYDLKQQKNNGNINGKKTDSKFYCKQSYSTKWIMSMYPFHITLKYEEGKKLLKIWNDGSVQSLVLLLRKYHNTNDNNNNNNIDTTTNKNDKHYYQFIKDLLMTDYPVDLAFCEYFIANVLRFCFGDLTIETNYERRLFLQGLTNNGKIPLLNQQLSIQHFGLSVWFNFIDILVINSIHSKFVLFCFFCFISLICKNYIIIKYTIQ